MEIVQKENGFTELAIEVASGELTKRNIQPDDINDYLPDKIDEEEKSHKLSLIELTLRPCWCFHQQETRLAKPL